MSVFADRIVAYLIKPTCLHLGFRGRTNRSNAYVFVYFWIAVGGTDISIIHSFVYLAAAAAAALDGDILG